MKTILFVTFIFTFTHSMGQNKIGNLTVSDSLFKKYLLNCYKRPDTLYERHSSHYHGQGSISEYTYDRHRLLAEEYNDQIRKDAIKKLDNSYIPQGWIVPRKPSEADFIKWLNRQKR